MNFIQILNSMKIIKTTVLSVLISLLALLSGCFKSEDASVLNVGISADYPPFEYMKQGEIVGFDIDLINMIATQLGKTVNIHDMDFNALMPAINSNRIDLAISGIAPSSERKKSFDFSYPYFKDTMTVLVKKGSDIKSVDDLGSTLIGVQLGSTMETFAKAIAVEKPSVQIKPLSLNPQIIEELKIGRIDAMIVGKVQAAAFCKVNTQLTYFTVEENLTNGSTEGYAMAFKKESSLRNEINKVLSDLKKSGKLAELEQKWIGQP